MWNNWYLEKLQQKKKEILAAGGEAKITKQHQSGKLLARERLEVFFDAGSFVEVDAQMEAKSNMPGDGVIIGFGKVNGQLVFAASQDFTIHGGSLGEIHAKKICKIMDKAFEVKAPFVSVNDSGGARIEEGVTGLSGYADIFYRNTMLSGVVPQIAAIMGPCAGGACYSPAIMDFIFMTEKTSQMYITGSQVVKSVTGELISAEELGGSEIHAAKSGVTHFVYPDDYTCLEGIRNLLSYLPQNNQQKPPFVETKKVDGSKKLQEIVPDNPRLAYDVRDVIDTLVDQKSFFEIQKEFAKNIIIGLARLDGETIGIVANQSSYIAGSLEINSSDKAARFVRFCDCFNIPILSLVDVPAFMPGGQQEHNGIIRHGAKLLYAFSEATVPKVSLIMRKAYGGAFLAMNSKGTGADIVYAWPIAEIAVMGAEGAVNIVGRKSIAAADNPEEERKKLIQEYNDRFIHPYIAAQQGVVDEVILPEETREKIALAFYMLRGKEKSIPNKKHGNIPL